MPAKKSLLGYSKCGNAFPESGKSWHGVIFQSVFPAAHLGKILLVLSVPKEGTRGSPLEMDGCVPAVLVPSVDGEKG